MCHRDARPSANRKPGKGGPSAPVTTRPSRGCLRLGICGRLHRMAYELKLSTQTILRAATPSFGKHKKTCLYVLDEPPEPRREPGPTNHQPPA